MAPGPVGRADQNVSASTDVNSWFDPAEYRTYGNESSLYLRVDERGVACQHSEKLDVCGNAHDLVFIQRDPEQAQSFGAIPAVYNELRDHGIIKHPDLRTLSEALLQP